MKRTSGIYKVIKNDNKEYYCFSYNDGWSDCRFLNTLDADNPGNGWRDWNTIYPVEEGLKKLKIKDGPYDPELFRTWAEEYTKRYPLDVMKLLYNK